MRWPTAGKQVLPALFPNGESVARRVLVTSVQRIISAGDKNSAPLDQTSGKKSRDRANNYLLKERRVHLW